MTDVRDPVTPPAPPAWRRTGRRGTAVLVAAIVIVCGAITAAITASRPGSPPSLVPGLSDQRPDPAKGLSGGGFTIKADTFSTEMDTFLCGTRDVRITSLSLYRPSSGIRLERWGLENASGVDDQGSPAVGSLRHLGPFDSHAITQHCGAAFYTRVGVQIRRTGSGTQSWLGLRLTYTSDGRQKVGYLGERFRVR